MSDSTKLRPPIQKLEFEMARGSIDGQGMSSVFGAQPNFNTSTISDIWTSAITGGPLLYEGFDITTAATASIVSANVNDTEFGTGIRKVLVFGIDENKISVQEEIIMDGATPVITDTKFLRLYRMEATQVGSTNFAAGSITATIGSILCAKIEANNNKTFQAFFSTPYNADAIIKTMGFGTYGTTPANTIVGGMLEIRSNGLNDQNAPFISEFPVGVNTGVQINYETEPDLYIPPASDVRMRATTTSEDGTRIIGGFKVFWSNGLGV